MEPTNGQCGVQPSAVLLVLTLIVTSIATALLCSAIMTEHWEYHTWNTELLNRVATTFHHNPLEWFLNGKVARINLTGNMWDDYGRLPTPIPSNTTPSIFFVPMSGGLWVLCTLLTEEEIKSLRNVDFPQSPCINYLTPEVIPEPINGFALLRDGAKTDWQHRMQNLSISCALVCLIILGCSALVGALGVLHQQISAVLVTGVMYLLAATFAFFTLSIIHFKRAQSQPGCPANQTTLGLRVDGVLVGTSTHRQSFLLGNASEFFRARETTAGWSLHLGWGGVGTCVFVSVLWILLSKIMRYNPLSALVAGHTVL